ncbi:MAG: PH domain-containing protein [Planctomycetota bacterium]
MSDVAKAPVPFPDDAAPFPDDAVPFPDDAFAFPDDVIAVDPRHVTAQRCVMAMIVIPLGIGLCASCLAIPFAMDSAVWGWIILAAIVMLTVIVAALLIGVFPRADYRRYRYRLNDQGFEIRSGIFWRNIILVPHERVQHADVTQGPLQRHFGLSNLTIHTAGTHNATVVLEGLSEQVAQQLRDQLVGKRGR